jgi:hypothetical protein
MPSSNKTYVAIPNTLYVVELEDYVILTGLDISKEPCVFPAYRFDRQHQAAYVACEEIAIKRGKKVADMVSYPPTTPHIYDPAAIRTSQSAQLNEDNTSFPGLAKVLASMEADYVRREKLRFDREKEDAAIKFRHIIA